MGVFCFSILSGMKAVFLFFCMVIAVVLAQQPGFQDTLVIDDFTTVTPQIIIQTALDSQYPIVQTRSTVASDVLGGERDLRLTVFSGTDNLVLSSGVFNLTLVAGSTVDTVLQFSQFSSGCDFSSVGAI